MIELYYWEGDSQAEDVIGELKSRGLEHKAIQLDPEAGGGEPCLMMSGKTYWGMEEALAALKAA